MADLTDPSLAPTASPISGEPEKARPFDSTNLSSEPEVPGLLSDCRLMLSFARRNAFV